MIELRHLTRTYSSGTGVVRALDDVSLDLAPGDFATITGPSGCGKSTLLRALSGQFQPIRGEVLFNDLSLYPNHESLRKYVTYIPQYDAFDEHLTIEENLNFAAAIRAPHLGRRERIRRIDGKLAELGR